MSALSNRWMAMIQSEKQEVLVKWALIASLMIHIIVLLIGNLDIWPRAELNEIAIDVELSVDGGDLEAPSKTVIPDSKKATEAAVPKNILPQVTKDFSVKDSSENEASEDSLADEKIEEAKEQAKVEEKQKNKEKQLLKPKEDASTELSQKEALRRLALEKLRQQGKNTAAQVESPEDDTLARISEALKDSDAVGQGDGRGVASALMSRRYESYLQGRIRNNYQLPSNYQYKTDKANVILKMEIGRNGKLLSVEISESSGDTLLDTYCIEAVKNSAPFKAPPDELANREFLLNFQP